MRSCCLLTWSAESIDCALRKSAIASAPRLFGILAVATMAVGVAGALLATRIAGTAAEARTG